MAIIYAQTKNAKYAARTLLLHNTYFGLCRQNSNKLARYVFYYVSSRVTVKSEIL